MCKIIFKVILFFNLNYRKPKNSVAGIMKLSIWLLGYEANDRFMIMNIELDKLKEIIN